MSVPKDIADLGVQGGPELIREARQRQEEQAIEPTPSPQEKLAFNEFVDLEVGAKVPAFPVDVLPDWLSDWVLEAAEVEQVPEDIAATLGLGAVANATMGKVAVSAFSSGSEPLNGYFVMVDRPGANKSGIFKRATSPVWEWWKVVDAVHQRRLSDWKAEKDVAEAAVQKQKKRLANPKASSPSEQGDAKQLLEEAYERLRDLEDEKPKADIRLCQDVTPEKLTDLLAESVCVGALSPEGAEVFDGLGRYQQKGENMDVFLKAWCGDALIVDRKNGTKLNVETPTLSILAMVQPKVLEGLQDPEGKRDGRGLLARFFWCVPQSRVGHRTLTGRQWNEAIRDAYSEALGRLCDLKTAEGERPVIAMSAGAREAFEEFYNKTEVDLRPGGELCDVEAMASKMRSHLARLAGWLHLADGRRIEEPIEPGTMKRAGELAEYFIAHGIVAHRTMQGPDEAVKRLLSLFHKARQLARGRADGLLEARVRDIAKKVKGRNYEQTSDVENALRQLETFGYVRVVERDRSKVVVFNPLASAGTPEDAGRCSGGE